MDDYRQIIHGAEPGQIVPIVKRIDMGDPLDFFSKLTDYGRAKNCCLLESREYLTGTGALSFGTARPALYLTGTGSDFTIRALTRTGKRMLRYLAADEQRWPGRQPEGLCRPSMGNPPGRPSLWKNPQPPSQTCL